MLLENPCRIKRGGIEQSAERPLPSMADVERLAEALPDHLGLVPWMASLAGLRKGELFGLARRHVDLGAGTVQVERALQEVTGVGAVMVKPKTQSSRRYVAMPKRLMFAVIDHLAVYVDEGPDSLLFTNSHGRPIRATVWSKAWNEARSESGLETVRLHDLRHLAGTLTAQAGATTKELMERMGHSSIDAAMRYQHVAAERNQEVARRIDDLL